MFSKICILWTMCLLNIISLISISISYYYIHSHLNGYWDLVENWETDFIQNLVDVKEVEDANNLPAERRGFMGYFSGTIKGCDCHSVGYCFYDGHWHSGLYTHSCNFNQSRCGCDDVQSLPPKHLINFSDESELVLNRTKNQAFKDVFDNMNSEGECEEE